MSRILEFMRGSGNKQQAPQINQQEAQSQWQRFLNQYGNCNPNQIMDQMIQRGEISPQIRDLAMGLAKSLTDVFHF